MPVSPAASHPPFYDPDHFQPQDSVGYLMRKVLSSIRTQADARVATHDLTYARDLETDPASMTRALDRLESKGLVVRERSSTDRRVVQLALTEEGRTVAALVPAVLSEVLNGHLTGFSHEEWHSLLGMLRRMLVNGEALRQQAVQPLDTPR